jgi:transposase
MNNANFNHGNVQQSYPQGLLREATLFCCLPGEFRFLKPPAGLVLMTKESTSGLSGSWNNALMALPTNPEEAASRLFPPQIAAYIVKLACERPDDIGRSLSQWFCQDLAHVLIEQGIVSSISSETIRRVLANHQLKPWRVHMWLSAKHPRDELFYQTIDIIIDLYTRLLAAHEIVLCVDEKTSLQPRPRLRATKPALPGNRPNLQEHEYKRAGALQLFAAFDTRSGAVYGQCYDRKRQTEFISFLEYLNQSIPDTITTIHVVADNVSTHHGKEVQKWLKKHPRFQFHFTPVHCSWINQVEQWFSVLQRKRFRIVDFPSKAALCDKIYQFISEWNCYAHPFNWSTKSVAKVMADAPYKRAA